MKRIILALFFLIATPAFAQNAITPAAPAAAPTEAPHKIFMYVEQPYDIVIGKASAPVTIVEYASLSCPHCAHFYNDVLPDITKKYIDTGKAKLIYRHYPLNDPALKGALLINCAEKDRRHEFLTVLFKMQTKWAFGPGYVDGLANIASFGGVTRPQFDACMADKVMETKIALVEKEANDDYAVTSTPTFFINNQVQQGVHDAASMGMSIDEAYATATKK